MTNTELLQIQPSELRFLFELKKQSSCQVHIVNMSDQYVAFKVKTTSPKKYCVRPNLGIIKPNETCDFTVIMQAQRTEPPDMQCKDKFLIQSTIVPFGTTEAEMTSDMFAKESEKYIEEKKLRVVLISPSSSPVLLPVNGDAKQEPNKVHMEKDRVPSGVENIPPPLRVSEEFKVLETAKNMEVEEDRRNEDVVARHSENENVPDIEPEKDVAQLNSDKDFEQLKSRLSIMDSKLRAAEVTILKLDEERRMNIHEKDLLKKELEVMRRKIDMRRVQAGGFPLLFVCMVALVSVVLGYYIHP
ncbi:hypothetical protein PIB30_014605 [Stylosanthes scabra]|uniref:MSP domain-containing protein n=1 Tax=Stylosanthes scabra TaxID=79078 RepID=A0ABU6R6Q6_9FABA|nr:hypothetical protein [Stylosanthes scabra]